MQRQLTLINGNVDLDSLYNANVNRDSLKFNYLINSVPRLLLYLRNLTDSEYSATVVYVIKRSLFFIIDIFISAII